MKPSEENKIRFYQQLGRVFFAVANADSNVHDKEIKALKKAIREDWVPIEKSTNDFGMDAAYQIEIVFDWMLEDKHRPETLLHDFKVFKETHPSLFNPELNALILKTADRIANSFNARNKKELVTLQQLAIILEN